MMFRIAGLAGVLLLLLASVVPASTQTEIFISDHGTLSNGRQTATIDVGFTCEHAGSFGYIITMEIFQPTGRSWAEGFTQFQDSCVQGEAVHLSVAVNTLAAAYKPGPATATVGLQRLFEDGGGFDWDEAHALATVKLKGGDNGSPPPSQAVIIIGEWGTLSNGRQTATVDVGFTCEHPDSYNFEINLRVVQPSGQSQAEGVAVVTGPCGGGEAVNVSLSASTSTTAFKPGPATVIVDLKRAFEDGGGFDWDDSHASATVKFKDK